MQRFAIILLLGLNVVSDVLAVEETQYSTLEWIKRRLVNMLCRLDSETESTSQPEVTPVHVLVCDDGWTRFGSSCYLVGKEKMNFERAKSFCEVFGAHLVSIQSESENDFIKDHVAQLSDAAYLWIGLTDQRNEGEWKWIYPDDEAQFVGWNTGEPNGGRGENCVVLGDKAGYNWIDVSCTNQYRPVCEK